MKLPFLLGAAVLLAGCSPALAPVEPLLPAAFDAQSIARGAALAAVGNCRSCHTARDGAAFAGGRPMHSPFGTIYSTNITPDPETGIGNWSLRAFQRAMREGIRNDGAHLYPAFPYDRFTRVTDEDNRALYAYLLSQPPVRHTPPRNELSFPFNVRAGLGLWKRLYFRPGAQPPDPAKDPTLARGEYLVEGLGHCGSCHSPRNALFAEERDRAYDGGDAEGWHAYAINARNAAPVPWDAEALAFYLRRGYHPRHGVSRGTMGIVTDELREASEADVKAMAAYVASLMGRRAVARRALRDAAEPSPLAPRDESAAIYRSACHGCHDGRAPLPFGGLPLGLSIGLHGASPRNLVNVLVHGLPPAEGETTPMMPGYAGALSEAQIERLVHWLRASFTGEPPWTGVERLVKEARGMKPDMVLLPPGGAGTDPALAPR